MARTQAEALSSRHAVRVLAADAPADLKPAAYQLQLHDVKISTAARLGRGVRHPQALAVLETELREHRPDVAFVHNIHSAWSYASLAVLAKHGVRSVLTYHDVVAFTPYTKLCRIPYRRQGDSYTFDYHLPWWHQLRLAKGAYRPGRNAAVRRLLAQATVRVAVSQALADALRANRVPVDQVIHNGRDAVGTDAPSSDATIFFGGRLSSSKGMLQVVSYLAALRDAHQLRPTVTVNGHEGAATDKLKTAAHAAGVADQLQFSGWLATSEYLRILASCRLVLVPSICFDSLPTVILDAMATSRPVVGSIFGGSRELVVDGKTGYVVDPFDVPAVAKCLANLLTDVDHAHALGTAGQRRLIEQFSTARMIQQYERLAGI